MIQGMEPILEVEEAFPSLPEGVCRSCLNCHLKRAPGCLHWCLKRHFELGASTVGCPTGLWGFKERYCRGLENTAHATAEESVNYWMENSDASTIENVLRFAEDVHNVRLAKVLHEELLGHLRKDHRCLSDPVLCLETCSKCRRRSSLPDLQQPKNTKSKPHIRTNSETIDIRPRVYLGGSLISGGRDTLPEENLIILSNRTRKELNLLDNTPEKQSTQLQDTEPVLESVGGLNIAGDRVSPSSESTDTGLKPNGKECTPAAASSSECSLPRKRKIKSHTPTEQGSKEPTRQHEVVPVQEIFFTSKPYYVLQQLKEYPGIRQSVIFLYLVIFVYHFLSMMLVTMCEDGGFLAIFDPKHNTTAMIAHRLTMFGLRIVGRVVTPAFCLGQLHLLATKNKRASDSMYREKKIIEGENVDMSVLRMSMVILHTVCFMGFLLYLGAFFLAEEKIVMEGVCNLDVMHSVFTLPWFNTQIFLMLVVESISVFLILLLVAVTTEFYGYENHTYVQKLPHTHYSAIRNRWKLLDAYCYIIPLVLTGFVLTSIYVSGRPFTPDPSDPIDQIGFMTWYFWVFILSGLTLLASSRHIVPKTLCVITHVLAVTFAVVVTNREGAMTVSPISASIVFLLFTAVASHAANGLYSLGKVHLRSCRADGSVGSLLATVYCFSSILLLAAACIVTGLREIIHLAQFIPR